MVGADALSGRPGGLSKGGGGHFCGDLNEVKARSGSHGRIREREPWAEGTVGTKALRWEGVLVQ